MFVVQPLPVCYNHFLFDMFELFPVCNQNHLCLQHGGGEISSCCRYVNRRGGRIAQMQLQLFQKHRFHVPSPLPPLMTVALFRWLTEEHVFM